MRQLFTFFLLAYLISWIIWLPLYGPALGLPHLPTLPFHHALGGLGPLLASFICTGWYQGPAGVRSLAARCVQVRPLLYFLIALFAPFLLALAAMFMSRYFDGAAMDYRLMFSGKEFPGFSIAELFLYNMLFFGWGEEAGWRGFALPRLQRRFSALLASVMLTLFWALWHWPLFFYRPGYMAMGWGGTSGWLFSLLTGSILLTWLFNASRGSILICAIFHATIDIAFTGNYPDQKMAGYMGMLITLWGIATLIIFRPGTLAPRPGDKVCAL